jgi:pyroglutamyl-peptidase
MFGLAARSRHLRIETRARNAVTRAVADVGGFLPASASIDADAAPALPLRVPAQRLLLAAKATGVPAALSRDAGCYLCNYLCWRAVEAADGLDAPKVLAFIHVPFVPRSQAHRPRRPALTLDDLAQAGEAIVRATVAAARQALPGLHSAPSGEMPEPKPDCYRVSA